MDEMKEIIDWTVLVGMPILRLHHTGKAAGGSEPT
jgi:hypothetical protein